MDPDRLAELTRTERRSLMLYWQLGDAGEVARALDVSTNTVRTHFRNARAKLKVSSTKAIAKAVAASGPDQRLINQPLTIPADRDPIDTTSAGHGALVLSDSLSARAWPDASATGLPKGRVLASDPVMARLRDIAMALVAIVAAVSLVVWLMETMPSVIAWNIFQH